VILDPSARTVTSRGLSVDVTTTEFEVLELLMRAVGRTVSRDALSTVIHQRPATAFERSLDVHVSRLRKKLEGAGLSIRAVRNLGYQLLVAP
jgi:two-component system response regulator CpxR